MRLLLLVVASLLLLAIAGVIREEEKKKKKERGLEGNRVYHRYNMVRPESDHLPEADNGKRGKERLKICGPEDLDWWSSLVNNPS